MVCCTRLKTVNLMALGPERKSTMNTKDTVITASATAAGLSGIGIGAYYLKSRQLVRIMADEVSIIINTYISITANDVPKEIRSQVKAAIRKEADEILKRKDLKLYRRFLRKNWTYDAGTVIIKRLCDAGILAADGNQRLIDVINDCAESCVDL